MTNGSRQPKYFFGFPNASRKFKENIACIAIAKFQSETDSSYLLELLFGRDIAVTLKILCRGLKTIITMA